MAENRFKVRQNERTAEQQKTLAKAAGASAPALAVDKSPVQVYMPKDMKKRLKTYCLQTDENMTSVIVPLLDEFLKKKGY